MKYSVLCPGSVIALGSRFRSTVGGALRAEKKGTSRVEIARSASRGLGSSETALGRKEITGRRLDELVVVGARILYPTPGEKLTSFWPKLGYRRRNFGRTNPQPQSEYQKPIDNGPNRMFMKRDLCCEIRGVESRSNVILLRSVILH